VSAVTIDIGVRQARVRTRAFDAERIALGTTAVAVAMLPLLVPRGPSNLGPADVLMAASIVSCFVWAVSSRQRWVFFYSLPMALFLAAGVLGALAGPVPNAGIVAILQDVFLLAWCWSLANICRSSARLRVLVATWAYSAIAWAILLFIGIAVGSTFLTGHSSREGSRTALTFVDPNVSANYYVISIMILWATGRPRRLGLRLLAYGLLVAALVTTGSNSGIVSLGVGVAVAAVLGTYRRGGPMPALALSMFILFSGYLAASNISISSIQDRAHASSYAFIRDGIGRGEVSVSQRSDLLHESLVLYKRGGLLGQGPVSTKPRLEREQAPFVKEAHDDYLSALIERGVIGFVALLMLITTVVFRGWAVARLRPGPGGTTVIVHPNALFGALIGTLVASTVYELLHVRHVWALFGLLAALSLWPRD
jgi:O-antigen ligase